MTTQEMMNKLEHDAWLANAQAETNAANIDYIAMMSDIEIPTEESEVETDAQPEI